MTTAPTFIDLDRSLLPGLIAVGFFGLFTAIILSAQFDTIQGFTDGGLTIVEDIGYAIIGAAGETTIPTEDFLVALILIAVLLDAALDGALLLATRDDGGEN